MDMEKYGSKVLGFEKFWAGYWGDLLILY